MDENKIAERIAAEDDVSDGDKAIANVDQAIDVIIAALATIDENLPLVKSESVPQQAALDNAREALEQGVKPYFADFVKDMSFFD